VFEAASIRKAIDQVERVAATPLTVLFAGETGTGKEVFARLLHRSSPRRNGPFVPFNCASIPHDMLDAQLFGHTRGSFTGAVADSIGVIRAAAGGTLFLDEVGELPPLAQPKLLRFLEHGEIHPIGATQPITVDVRVVAATNSDLVAMVRDKTFREDLYFRLNGITITVPPLRERRDDIPSLVRLYLGRAAGAMGRPTPVVSAAAMELLLLHPWPGNVRQLVVEMRRLVALLPPGREITADALAEVIGTLPGAPPAPRPLEPAADTGPPPATASPAATLADAVDDLERRMIHDALREAGGNVATTAARLGISRKGLFLKRRRLGID
jgi:hydrogenase-4 transcriptional activator